MDKKVVKIILIVVGVMFVGFVGLVLIFALMLKPTLDKARERARKVSCASNLNQFGKALMMYSGDNEGRYPEKPGIEGIKQINDYIDISGMGFDVMVCPSSGHDHRNRSLTESNIGYAYVGAGLQDNNASPTMTPLAFDKPQNHMDGYINVLFVDGHVEGFDLKSQSCGEFAQKLLQNNGVSNDLVIQNAKLIDQQSGR